MRSFFRRSALKVQNWARCGEGAEVFAAAGRAAFWLIELFIALNDRAQTSVPLKNSKGL
jgi:hypothetical protein